MVSAGEITVELIQKILRESEKDNSTLVIPDLIVKELNEDLHAGSCLSRVKVNYKKQGDTSQHSLSMLVKTAPKNTAVAKNLEDSTFFPREIQMFSEILPRMSVLLSQALSSQHVEFFPRGLYTHKSPNYVIAMEDLAPKGFTAQARKNGFDLEHCLLSLRMLARFHAASVIIHNENESLFDVFDQFYKQDASVMKVEKQIISIAFPIVVKAAESWPEFGFSWAKRLRLRYQTIHEDLGKIYKRNENGFNVLIHGDFGLHNVMFRHSESSGELEAIMFVDFQCCSYNSPAFDLHKFIFTSANDEVIDNHIDTLLKEYHSELTITLERLGAPKEQTITLKQLLSEFERTALFGLHYTVCFMSGLRLDIQNSDATAEIIFSNDTDDATKTRLLLPDSTCTSLRKMWSFFSKKQLP